MSKVSVSKAAHRLGVNVSRVHQRIADGSLRAERFGSQWLIDERSLLEVAERRKPGRPLSARSAWAVIATSEGDENALRALAPSERSRARARLNGLVSKAEDWPITEEILQRTAVLLRSTFRRRAERLLFRAAPADLDDVRADDRWQTLVSSSATEIASTDVEGYLPIQDVEPMITDFLLVPAVNEANVIMHLLPDGQVPYPGSKLRLAADLVEHRRPREEARAAELLHQLAREYCTW